MQPVNTPFTFAITNTANNNSGERMRSVLGLAFTPSVHHITTSPNNSDKSTADTIRVMRNFALEYSRHPLVITAVQNATATLLHPTPIQIVQAIYEWVKQHVAFTEHFDETVTGGWDMELLLAPPVLLSMSYPNADCDDFSTLLASMLIVANLGRIYFVTIAADSLTPDRFSHVYVLIALPTYGKVALDASHGTYTGWEHYPQYRRKEWLVG